MPAKSKSQQRFMGMVHAAHEGEKPASKEVARAAKGIDKEDAKDFAETKHKGLPEKVKKNEDISSALKNAIREAIKKEMSAVGGVAGFNAPSGTKKAYHGDHVIRRKGVYKSDVEEGEKKRPRKKGKEMIGKGPQGDKHFNKVESIKITNKKTLNEFISDIIASDLLHSDMTPECMDGVGKLQQKLSNMQVDINTSFQHAQEFLKSGIKTHREIEFKRMAVEAKRLSNLVTQYKNVADQLANMAGDINNRAGTKELVIKMQQQQLGAPENGGEEENG